MAHEQYESLGGWFLKYFKQGIGGTSIHIFRAIDDDDPPTAARCFEVKKLVNLSHMLDDDHRPHFFLFFVVGALDGQQIRMAAAGDLPEDRRARRHLERSARVGEEAALV